MIAAFHPVFLECAPKPAPAAQARWIATREWQEEQKKKLLLVDPETLVTSVGDEEGLECAATTPQQWSKTRLMRAVDRETEAPFPLQNDGLTHSEAPVSGVFLTVDLCPSHHPELDRNLFEALDKIERPAGTPVPVAISISGGWLKKHVTELLWLQERAKDAKLAITWVNHSYTHPFDEKAPIEKNFLLSPGVDAKQEILANEQLLLETGITPTVFFRFPGLVSDEKLIELARELTVIPVGADAWLAKGEKPSDGSIILVHGNGNEPAGIQLFLDLLAKFRDALPLLPLTDAISR